MKSESAPLITNFLLYYYEDKWVRKIKQKDFLATQKVFRFIDDMTAINGGRELEKNFHET